MIVNAEDALKRFEKYPSSAAQVMNSEEVVGLVHSYEEAIDFMKSEVKSKLIHKSCIHVGRWNYYSIACEDVYVVTSKPSAEVEKAFNDLAYKMGFLNWTSTSSCAFSPCDSGRSYLTQDEIRILKQHGIEIEDLELVIPEDIALDDDGEYESVSMTCESYVQLIMRIAQQTLDFTYYTTWDNGISNWAVYGGSGIYGDD